MKCRTALAMAAVTALMSGTAHAAITFTIQEVGSGVTIAGTGSFITAGLKKETVVDGDAGIRSTEVGFINIGNTAGEAVYYGLTGPAGFGDGPFVAPSSSSGTGVGFSAGIYLLLDSNYVSGSAISSFSRYDNESLRSLGLTAGEYTYSLNGDTVSVTVLPAAPGIPEPATWAMMLGGFGAIGLGMRRRQRTTVRYA